MFTFFQKYTRQFAFCMMVLVINLSIDAPDQTRFVNNQHTFEEDLSINEIESISEWALEDLFDLKNAVPESDDNDEESICKIFADYLFCNNPPSSFIFSSNFIAIPYKKVSLFSHSLWYNISLSILIQPPKF